MVNAPQEVHELRGLPTGRTVALTSLINHFKNHTCCSFTNTPWVLAIVSAVLGSPRLNSHNALVSSHGLPALVLLVEAIADHVHRCISRPAPNEATPNYSMILRPHNVRANAADRSRTPIIVVIVWVWATTLVANESWWQELARVWLFCVCVWGETIEIRLVWFLLGWRAWIFCDFNKLMKKCEPNMKKQNNYLVSLRINCTF